MYLEQFLQQFNQIPELDQVMSFNPLDEEELKISYKVDYARYYYNGPSSGICTWNERQFWYKRVITFRNNPAIVCLFQLPDELMIACNERLKIESSVFGAFHEFDDRGLRKDIYRERTVEEKGALTDQYLEAARHLPSFPVKMDQYRIVAYSVV